MEDGDDAALTAAMLMRGEAVVSSMGLGHAPSAGVQYGTIVGGVNGAIFGADKAVRERWERMVTVRLDNGEGLAGWCTSGGLLVYALYHVWPPAS